MMKNGGQAFPTGSNKYRGPGMTLRDWFAGQALASMTVAPDYLSGPCNAIMAERAYVIADSMLAVRAQSEEKS